jgi:hypothetical protein
MTGLAEPYRVFADNAKKLFRPFLRIFPDFLGFCSPDVFKNISKTPLMSYTEKAITLSRSIEKLNLLKKAAQEIVQQIPAVISFFDQANSKVSSNTFLR